MKAMVIEIKFYQSKTTLMKLNYAWKISEIISEHLAHGKIQLKIAFNFISSNDNDKKHVMHSKSNNIKIMIHDKVGEVIKSLFESVYNRYQIVLKTSMKGSDFIFNCINLLHYKCYKKIWIVVDHL